MSQLELIVDAKAELGEGPAWDHRRQQLIWVNIMEKQVNVYNPATGLNQTHSFDQYVGAAVPAENGDLILAMHHGFYRWTPGEEQPILIHDPEGPATVNRFNDGKCDPAGRFWAGTMGMNGEQGTGALYRLDPDGRVHRMAEDITCSNGLDWSPDATTMYYIDSPTHRIFSFDFDLDSGDIRNRKVVVEVAPEDGFPDGMSIDEEGMLWVAHWGGYQVIRYNPNDGKILQRFKIPANQTSSCAFGGANLDELYITTARIGRPEEELKQTPHEGGLFRIKLDVRGMPLTYFKG